MLCHLYCTPIELRVLHGINHQGAATLAMIYDYMERVLPGSFKRGTNHYLTEHAYSTVVSEDFWSALGAACDSGTVGCAGIAAGMGGAWTRSAGYPVLRVSRRGGGLSIRQRPVNPENPASSGAVWWLPLVIGDSSGAVESASCAASSTSCIVGQPAGLSTGTLVLNPTGTGLYRVEYDDYTEIFSAVSAGAMDRTLPMLPPISACPLFLIQGCTAFARTRSELSNY